MQRRTSKQTRGPNQHEKNFQAWLKERPCCITGRNDVIVHHCKGSTFKHNKVLIGHLFCIPLCESAHNLYHAGTKDFTNIYGLQCDLWKNEYEEYLDWIESWFAMEAADALAIMDYGR